MSTRNSLQYSTFVYDSELKNPEEFEIKRFNEYQQKIY
jgi:hypothetical protein